MYKNYSSVLAIVYFGFNTTNKHRNFKQHELNDFSEIDL